jgi:hypothetical protein
VGRGQDRLVAPRRHQELHEVHAGSTVDHAVMHLLEQREAPVLEPLDHPELPQRSRAIQAVAQQSRAELLEL